MKHILLFVMLIMSLSGCATTPNHIDNACAVLSQNDSIFFNSWQQSAKKAEKKYGIAMPIILATIYTESGFRQRVRAPRTKLLGFIPWSRKSTSHGYSQALTGTWDGYRRSSGNTRASRTNFDDSVDFIGWYYRESVRRNGINPNDVYSLYLSYYMGQSAYAQTGGRASAAVMQVALNTDQMARRYDRQLRFCGRR